MREIAERHYPADAFPPVSEKSGDMWSNWSSPEFYQQVIEPIGIAASTSERNLRSTLKLLWSANCTSVSKKELVKSQKKKFEQTITVISKNIREHLPLDLSLYYLEKDERFVLMPTIPDYTFVLFPEDIFSIQNEEYPEESLPFVIWLNQRQTRPKYEKTKATTVFSRASSNVVKLGGLLAKNFNQKLSVENIIEELNLTNPREVYIYMGKLAELVSNFPGELRFTITKTESLNEHEIEYALEYALEDGPNSILDESDIKNKFPDTGIVLDKYYPLEALSIIDPTGLEPDARMNEASDPENSWDFFYTRLAIAQEACKASLQELINLETD